MEGEAQNLIFKVLYKLSYTHYYYDAQMNAMDALLKTHGAS